MLTEFFVAWFMQKSSFITLTFIGINKVTFASWKIDSNIPVGKWMFYFIYQNTLKTNSGQGTLASSWLICWIWCWISWKVYGEDTATTLFYGKDTATTLFYGKDTRNNVVLDLSVYLLLTFNTFCTTGIILIQCFYNWLWTCLCLQS